MASVSGSASTNQRAHARTSAVSPAAPHGPGGLAQHGVERSFTWLHQFKK
ncbi:hypothetical protein [Streptomyces sp. NRRL F-5053]|nr:hypothetical protein [Streptomyces sp. NRRL F-5053]